MKLPFNLGVSQREPFLYVKDGQMEGSYKPYFYARFYFLFQKFNVNIIDLGSSEKSVCYETGLCTGSLASLQSGLINFGDTVTTDQFPTLPVNLTVGPVLTEDKCHLINVPSVKIDIRSEDFLDLDERFDFPCFAISMVYCLGLILLLVLTNCLLSNLSYRLTVWDFFGIAFNSDRLPLVNVFSYHGLNFAWYSFLMTTIFIASLQTGLIKARDYARVETFQDVLSSHYIPTTLSTLYCRYSIEKSTSPSLKRINRKLDVVAFDRSKGFAILELLEDKRRVFIMSSHSGLRIKGSLCMVRGSETSLHISHHSVFQLLFMFTLSSSTYVKTKEAAYKYALQAFETSCYHNHVTHRTDFMCLGLNNFYSHCIQDQIHEQDIILTPLKLEYFDRILIVFYFASLTGAIIFLFESIFPPDRVKLIQSNRERETP